MVFRLEEARGYVSVHPERFENRKFQELGGKSGTFVLKLFYEMKMYFGFVTYGMQRAEVRL